MTAMSASVSVGKATCVIGHRGASSGWGGCSTRGCANWSFSNSSEKEPARTGAPEGACVAFGRRTRPVRVGVGGRKGIFFLAVEVVVAIRPGLVRLVLRLRCRTSSGSRPLHRKSQVPALGLHLGNSPRKADGTAPGPDAWTSGEA